MTETVSSVGRRLRKRIILTHTGGHQPEREREGERKLPMGQGNERVDLSAL